MWNSNLHWAFCLKLQAKGQGNGYQTLFCGLSSFLSLSHENLNVIWKCWQLTKYVPITFDETALEIFQVIFYLYWIICYIFQKKLYFYYKAEVTVLKYYQGYGILWSLSLALKHFPWLTTLKYIKYILHVWISSEMNRLSVSFQD